MYFLFSGVLINFVVTKINLNLKSWYTASYAYCLQKPFKRQYWFGYTAFQRLRKHGFREVCRRDWNRKLKRYTKEFIMWIVVLGSLRDYYSVLLNMERTSWRTCAEEVSQNEGGFVEVATNQMFENVRIVVKHLLLDELIVKRTSRSAVIPVACWWILLNRLIKRAHIVSGKGFISVL